MSRLAARHPRPRRLRFWLGWLLAMSLLPFAICAAAILLSGQLLGLPDATGKADVMVVLGGDGPARADRAIGLWHAGAAPRVLIVGRNDCGSIADRMEAGGVPRSAMTLECLSASTWENAEFARPLLAATGARKVLLVTNWFHARRALASFRGQCPNLDFNVDSVGAPSFGEIATGPYGPAVLLEYPKTVIYTARLWLADLSGIGKAQAASGEGGKWMGC